MRLDVESVIYGYVFICVALLVFNLFYIFRSKGRAKKSERLAARWGEEILTLGQLALLGQELDARYLRRLPERLHNTDALLAWSGGLELAQQAEPETAAAYVRGCLAPMQELAFRQRGKSSMDRAYFASLIARFPPCGGAEFRPLMEALLNFLPNSTVYCRENVLHALCALGNAQAVENLLELFNANGWFHHHKLLADGLLEFRGDREALARALWAHYGTWNANLMVGVAQFITGLSASFQGTFFPLLTDKHADIEIRLAAMRYFRRWPYAPARALGIEFLRAEGAEGSLAIVAAAMLEKYPGEDTVAALKRALGHPNWYVRYNAATSLVGMGLDEASLSDVLNGSDRYAREILTYKLQEGKRAAKQAAAQDGKAVAE